MIFSFTNDAKPGKTSEQESEDNAVDVFAAQIQQANRSQLAISSPRTRDQRTTSFCRVVEIARQVLERKVS